MDGIVVEWMTRVVSAVWLLTVLLPTLLDTPPCTTHSIWPVARNVKPTDLNLFICHHFWRHTKSSYEVKFRSTSGRYRLTAQLSTMYY